MNLNWMNESRARETQERAAKMDAMLAIGTEVTVTPFPDYRGNVAPSWNGTIVEVWANVDSYIVATADGSKIEAMAKIVSAR